MARIPDEEIERLKREISIERLVAGFGIELKRHGANLVGRCPFHDDHTPSLIVTPENNLWACKGKCNMGGSVIDWVMLSLCELFGVKLCTLFGIFFKDGRTGGPTGEARQRALDRFHPLQPHLENGRPLKAVAAAEGIPFRTVQR